MQSKNGLKAVAGVKKGDCKAIIIKSKEMQSKRLLVKRLSFDLGFWLFETSCLSLFTWDRFDSKTWLEFFWKGDIVY